MVEVSYQKTVVVFSPASDPVLIHFFPGGDAVLAKSPVDYQTLLQINRIKVVAFSFIIKLSLLINSGFCKPRKGPKIPPQKKWAPDSVRNGVSV